MVTKRSSVLELLFAYENLLSKNQLQNLRKGLKVDVLSSNECRTIHGYKYI
jgi:hypothetical protein